MFRESGSTKTENHNNTLNTNQTSPTIDKNTTNQNSTNTNQSSKTFFQNLWPIKREELAKFLYIVLLMFCILGIQNLIRSMKDSIVNTMIGTETISFLKFWGVLPAAFFITIIYVKLVNVMKGEKIFYLIISIFLGFFFLFAFFLYPNHEMLHLNKNTAAQLVTDYPHFKWFILLLSNWSFSIFYVIAELWPNAILALLVWQFVNNITTVDESKRFYPLFGLISQTGLFVSGLFLQKLSVINNFVEGLFNLNYDINVLSIQIVIFVVTILGIIGLFAFWQLNHRILDVSVTENLQFKVKRSTMTIRESLKMAIESKYIRLIAILLFCYGMAINLVEGPWKAQATSVYRTPIEFMEFQGQYLKITGIATPLLVLVCSAIVRIYGWFAAALITPFVVFSTGLAFFLISNFDSIGGFMLTFLSFTDPVMLAIVIGAVQNVLSKSTKYTLFDSTKEMAYVPLNENLKTRGKAAADMIGVKLGKSMSSLLQSMIFIIVPTASYASISVFLMIAFAIVCIIWIWAITNLNVEYQDACESSLKTKKL